MTLSTPTPDVGSQVLGRYLLGERIGRGATATVHRARDLATGADVAVKVIPVDLDLASRAGAEVRAAARFSHPGLVRLMDWGEDRDAFYLVSELVEGETLARHLREGGLPGGDPQLLEVVADVLEALEHVHSRGVVHRDVKPANILVGSDGRTRLADLGIALLSGEARMTMTGGVVGTVAYMAPEQAWGEEVGPAADVYSACLTLYEGLTGANPNLGASPAETARRAAAGPPVPLAKARPDLPRALASAVDAGLARDPGSRPLPGVLATALRASSVVVRAAIPPRWVRMAPALAAGAGGAALAAFVAERADGDLPMLAVAVAALAGGALAARAPRIAAFALAVVGALLLARVAPATGAVVGVLGLGVLAAAPRSRAILLPAAAPALFALGLGPLYAVAAGLVRGVWGRIWAAVAGAAAAVGWVVLAGSDQGILFGSERTEGAAGALADESSPLVVLERLAEPLRQQPQALAGAALLVAFALAVPVLVRAPAGRPRVVAACLWALAFATLAIALADGADRAPETLLGSCILVAAWAARPWRLLFRRADGRPTVTLRGPAA